MGGGKSSPFRKPVHVRPSYRSVLPKPFEPVGGQLRVPNGMLNVAMAEVGLQGAGVVALVGQGITASVPKHVRMRLEGQLGLPTRPFDHAGEASRTKRPPRSEVNTKGDLGSCSR